MKLAKKWISALTGLLLMAVSMLFVVACDGGVEEPEPVSNKPAAIPFEAANDPHIVEDGEDLYYVVDGVRQNGVFGFYNNILYYFTKRDNTGVDFTVKRVTEHITAVNVKTGSTIYIITGDESALVIDTSVGIGNTKELVELFLGDMPYQVALTHVDPDHAGGVCDFENVYTMEADAVQAPQKWTLQQRLDHCGVTETSGYYCAEDFAEVDDSYGGWVCIEPGYTFDLGNYTIETVGIPGHTPGSLGYLFKSDRLLLTGDAACAHTLQADYVESYKATLTKLNERNAEWDWVLDSHSSADLLEKTLIDDLIECCNKIMANYPQNAAEGDAELKWGPSVNGHYCKFDTSKIYLEDKES